MSRIFGLEQLLAAQALSSQQAAQNQMLAIPQLVEAIASRISQAHQASTARLGNIEMAGAQARRQDLGQIGQGIGGGLNNIAGILNQRQQQQFAAEEAEKERASRKEIAGIRSAGSTDKEAAARQKSLQSTMKQAFDTARTTYQDAETDDEKKAAQDRFLERVRTLSQMGALVSDQSDLVGLDIMAEAMGLKTEDLVAASQGIAPQPPQPEPKKYATKPPLAYRAQQAYRNLSESDYANPFSTLSKLFGRQKRVAKEPQQQPGPAPLAQPSAPPGIGPPMQSGFVGGNQGIPPRSSLIGIPQEWWPLLTRGAARAGGTLGGLTPNQSRFDSLGSPQRPGDLGGLSSLRTISMGGGEVPPPEMNRNLIGMSLLDALLGPVDNRRRLLDQSPSPAFTPQGIVELLALLSQQNTPAINNRMGIENVTNEAVAAHRRSNAIDAERERQRQRAMMRVY